MKQKLFLRTLLIFTLFINSCSKDDSEKNNGLAQTPEALAQYNNSNYGIYKGVFIGSSGIIIVNVNNGNAISATLIVDGITYNFTTTQTIQQNQTTVISFVSGNNTFTFSVSSNGTNPTFSNLVINGHPNAAIIAVKETSSTLVKCYEGSYSGDDMGTFNAIIYGNELKSLAYSTLAQVHFTATGIVENNQITAGTVSTGSTFSGSLNGNNVNGSWANSQFNNSGSWTGTRTY